MTTVKKGDESTKRIQFLLKAAKLYEKLDF